MRGNVRAGAVETLAAIVSVNIGYQANPWQKLPFQRCLPSIQVRGVVRDDGSAVVGIAEEHVSPGWNL